MTDTPQDQPLHLVMNRAYMSTSLQHEGCAYTQSIAAEIRAVADWLVPPELEQLKPQDWAVRIKWRTGLELRQRLLAEADRAERGEC